ncbi:hypothetical protein [Methanosarcina spelaei]|uniref:hypothetical protein n=1 Tax=Methanosarcina spelaei TaxID=1036679 RepID=UPI00148333AB|nr:hypothetical protein [Methanosarcina spelaei]
MAKPIELGLVLEGEDAKEFFRNERNPIVSKKLVEMFKRDSVPKSSDFRIF